MSIACERANVVSKVARLPLVVVQSFCHVAVRVRHWTRCVAIPLAASCVYARRRLPTSCRNEPVLHQIRRDAHSFAQRIARSFVSMRIEGASAMNAMQKARIRWNSFLTRLRRTPPRSSGCGMSKTSSPARSGRSRRARTVPQRPEVLLRSARQRSTRTARRRSFKRPSADVPRAPAFTQPSTGWLMGFCKYTSGPD